MHKFLFLTLMVIFLASASDNDSTDGKLPKPKIHSYYPSIYLHLGDVDSEVRCTTKTIAAFKWQIEANDTVVDIDGLKRNYRVVNKSDTESSLYIKKVEQSSRAVYICKASNAYGTSSAKVQVRVSSRYEFVWPFLGIIFQVIFLSTWNYFYVTRIKKRKIQDLTNPRIEIIPPSATQSMDI